MAKGGGGGALRPVALVDGSAWLLVALVVALCVLVVVFTPVPQGEVLLQVGVFGDGKVKRGGEEGGLVSVVVHAPIPAACP